MDFNEYLKNKGYKKGDFIPKTTANQLHSAWLKDGEDGGRDSKKGPKIAPEEAMSQIENALNIGDERAIKLPDQVIKSAALAYGKGDLKGAAKIAEDLAERINTAIKLQDEEEKDIRTTAEGIQVAIGKKTGTVYTGGVPVSRGRENTGSFNSFLVQPEATEGMIPTAVIGDKPPTQEMVGELETVRPQPELYAQPTKPEDETDVPRATEYIKKARVLYSQGDIQGALDILRGTSLMTSFVGGIQKSDLPDILGVSPQQATPQPTQVPTGNERPSLDSIMNPKKTK